MAINRIFMTAVIILIIGIIILGFIFYSLLSMKNSPEKTLYSYNEKINEGNARDALDLTLQAFADSATYSFYLRDLEGLLSSPDVRQAIVDVKDVLYEDELSVSMKDYVEDKIELYVDNPHYSINLEDVEEYCFLYFTLTIFTDGEAEINYELTPCIKINSSWYLMVYSL